MCNFKELHVAETAHPTTTARLIGRSMFSDMALINFLRAEFRRHIQANWLALSSRQFLSLHYRCGPTMWLAA
jgi:hypothetical protein